MSAYYKYNFVSPEPIYALIKEELNSYFATGSLDDILFPTYTDKCLDRLGRSTYAIAETLLEIDDFMYKLPANFYAVREAWACTITDTINYKEGSSTYTQLSTKISDPCDDPCVDDCSDACRINPDIITVIYKTNRNYHVNLYKQFLLKPGSISADKQCNLDCANYGSTALDTFDIQGNKFVTNFRAGSVYLIYYAKDFDEIGNQLVPDDLRIKEYIEKFIKAKLFERLSNQASDETAKQLEYKAEKYLNESNEAYENAKTHMKLETIEQKRKAISRTQNRNNKYIIR